MKSPTESIKHAYSSLITARDDARMRFHLLSLDGRQKWDEIETKAGTLEQRVEARAEKGKGAPSKVAQGLAHVVHDFTGRHLHKH